MMRFLRICRPVLCLWLVAAVSGQTPQSAPPASPATPTAAVSAAPGAQILPTPPAYHFPDGLTYFFSVEWHHLNAGNASVNLESAGAEQHVTAMGDSSGMVNLLYKVQDRFESFFDPHTFCSQRLLKHTEEGSRHRDTELRFDYTKRRAILNEKNLKTNETKRIGNEIPGCVTDVVSGFFYLASLPLAAGSAYTFPINDGGMTAEVTATVEAPEEIKVPAGTFQTIRVRAEPISGPQKGKIQVYVWFTDDPNRTPVQMRSKLGWGMVMFRLQRVGKN